MDQHSKGHLSNGKDYLFPTSSERYVYKTLDQVDWVRASSIKKLTLPLFVCNFEMSTRAEGFVCLLAHTLFEHSLTDFFFFPPPIFIPVFPMVLKVFNNNHSGVFVFCFFCFLEKKGDIN